MCVCACMWCTRSVCVCVCVCVRVRVCVCACVCICIPSLYTRTHRPRRSRKERALATDTRAHSLPAAPTWSQVSEYSFAMLVGLFFYFIGLFLGLFFSVAHSLPVAPTWARHTFSKIGLLYSNKAMVPVGGVPNVYLTCTQLMLLRTFARLQVKTDL
jgi:hypothetical protein